MTNFAIELADLFDEWRMVNASPLDVRHREDDDEVAFWRRQTHAVGLLESSVRAVTTLKATGQDVRGFEPYIPEWYGALFSISYPWNQSTTTPALRSEAIGALRSLGLIVSMQGQLRAPASARTGELRGLVADAKALLEAHRGDLEGDEFLYVFRLVGAVEDALADRAALGSINLRDHVDRLNGALLSLGSQLRADGDSEEGSKFLKTALNIVASYRGLLADVSAYAAITGVTLQQLT